MVPAAPRFFRTGGTLQPDAPSYVVRAADANLFDALKSGEFCYILTSRQMGKSSLMARTAVRLRQEAGIAAVLLDLSGMGKNLSLEQWYAGLLSGLGQLRVDGRSLGLEDDLWSHYADEAQRGLGAYPRWARAVELVLLPRCPVPIVVFVDEIDSVLSLPFSTDEFFAGVREMYNRRVENPLFERLTFCLAGVATPSDLIREARSTPFNIGRGIELADFTESEALALAAGLPGAGAGAAVRRVVYWTGGHPYLTQRLCQALLERSEALDHASVDATVAEVFLTQTARERDDNLGFVRNRLLASDADRASLLDLYDQVLRGRRVVDNGLNPLAALLRLSGIVRRDGAGRLHPRNRIYGSVFDRAWVRDNLPDAEVERQKRAYRRGLLRASAAFTTVIGGMGGMLALTLDARRKSDQSAFRANMSLAGVAFRDRDVPRARQILEEYRPQAEYRRRIEWRLLTRLCHAERLLLDDLPTQPVTQFLAPGGDTLTVLGMDGSMARRSLLDGTPRACAPRLSPPGLGAFSPDGARVATADASGRVALREVDSGDVLWEAAEVLPKGTTWCISFAPDGRAIAIGGTTGRLRVIDAGSGAVVRSLDRGGATVTAVQFAASAPWLAVGTDTGGVFVLDRATGRERRAFRGLTQAVRRVRFSADSTHLVAVGVDGKILDGDTTTGASRTFPEEHRSVIWDCAFSPNGDRLATVSLDATAVVWDFAAARVQRAFRGHTAPLWRVGWCGEDRLVTADDSGQARLWDVPRASALDQDDVLLAAALSADGATAVVATASDAGSAHRHFEMGTGRKLGVYPSEPQSPTWALDLSPGGDLLASGHDDGVRLWSLPGHRLIRALPGAPGSGVSDPIQAVAMDPEGVRIAACSDSGRLSVWDRLAGALLWTRATGAGASASLPHLAFLPGRGWLVAGLEKSLRVVDAVSGDVVSTVRGGASIEALVSDEAGRQLAVYAAGEVLVYDCRTWRLRNRFEAPGTSAIAFAPGGDMIVAGGTDGKIKLWEIATGQETLALTELRHPIRGLRFSRSGSVLNAIDNKNYLWQYAAM